MFFIGVAVMVFGTWGCNTKQVYNDYHQISDYKWKIDNVLTFEVPITDTLTPCNVYVNIRNTGSYAYSNLWLFINEKTPNGDMLNDKFNCKLATPNGKWFGKGFGDIYDLQILYKKNVVFKKSGIYSFKITQGMRDKVLDGIVNIGIQIEKAENSCGKK